MVFCQEAGCAAPFTLEGWALAILESVALVLLRFPGSPLTLAAHFRRLLETDRRAELESLAKGVDPYHEAWLDAPFGTEDKPVEVTSEYAERIVGVADPDDDSIIWWGLIEEGQPPRQIVEGGEFFVLKKLSSSGGHH